ncbi:ankyrin repeat-containing protein [Legionella lansingensis]|uniref:Ankyrin repeat-containing protein n=1 Tax=Legionella lansingensis TaxID=45067 RepID=A0A0W0VLC4_9GAMM|nr:ankyrin repeat domain-containing protein [Legionella lansingensis]KTD20930.1 ankyrin repeat-containing protein [Legionella lansingensis]SNV44347.1 ankyrin repeat-containing protein [Legionella lansingensis]
MIYYFYILLILLALVVVHQCTTFFIPDLWDKLLDFDDKTKLSHDDLLTLLDRFKYTHDDGICFGFTLTWAQDVTLENERLFYQRLNVIRQEKHYLPRKVNRVTQKIKNQENISSYEDQLIETKPFIEAVCLAQSPEDYSDVYAKRLHQIDINSILAMIRYKLAGNTSAKRIFGKTFAFEAERNVIDFLQHLNDLLKLNDKLAMLISSEEHTVGLKKHPEGWLFLDINYLYEQSPDYPYMILNHQELCKQLYLSLEENNHMIFHLDFIAKLPSTSIQARLQQLNYSYPVFPKQLSYVNNRELGMLPIAAQNGDECTVREIVRLSHHCNCIDNDQVAAGMRMTLNNNHTHILDVLVKIRGFNINGPCQTDGSTALAIACNLGYVKLVKRLLACHEIHVNEINNKKLTPLMIACESEYTQQSPELFKLLLHAGARLDLQNAAGESALAIAQRNKNLAAMEAIQAFNVPRSHPKATGSSSHRYIPKHHLTPAGKNHPSLFFSKKSALQNPASPSLLSDFSLTQQQGEHLGSSSTYS